MPQSPQPPEALRQFAPKLADYTTNVLFGDLWERKELSKRDRSLITCAVLAALNRPEQLPIHLKFGIDNGLTRSELSEMITHIAFYAGWPCAVTAAKIAYDLFSQDCE